MPPVVNVQCKPIPIMWLDDGASATPPESGGLIFTDEAGTHSATATDESGTSTLTAL